MQPSQHRPVAYASIEPSDSNMQNQLPLLIGSPQSSAGPEVGLKYGPAPKEDHLTIAGVRLHCYLCQPAGSRHYARQGDLTRHIKTYHGAPSRFLCHVHGCPRSITGNGFPRRDKLVDHLKSSKRGHGLSPEDADYQAAFHNRSHSNAVPLSLPHNAAYEDVFQQPTLPSTNHGDLIDQASMHGSVHHNSVNNLAFHDFAAFNNVVDQGAPNNHFFDHTVNQGILGSTFYENPVDQANSQNIYYADAEGQPTCNTILTFDMEDDSAWH